MPCDTPVTRPIALTVAEGEEIAVRADAGIFVSEPGTAEALLRLQHDEAGAGTLLGQVVGATHT